MTDVKEELKRIRRLNKEARMRAKGTWKNNEVYKETYSPVIKFDPIITEEKSKKPKRFSQLPQISQENIKTKQEVMKIIKEK